MVTKGTKITAKMMLETEIDKFRHVLKQCRRQPQDLKSTLFSVLAVSSVLLYMTKTLRRAGNDGKFPFCSAQICRKG